MDPQTELEDGQGPLASPHVCWSPTVSHSPWRPMAGRPTFPACPQVSAPGGGGSPAQLSAHRGAAASQGTDGQLSLIHISEPTRPKR